jgi:2-polyprenyl-3-methyl-5-hydroxy-6-metoxy-1,4-benzoquinol methylase
LERRIELGLRDAVREIIDEKQGSRRATTRRRRRSRSRAESASAGWQRVAGWYDALVGERGSEYQREVVIPRTLHLLEAKAGERVLDVACGQGVLCRALAERHVRVTGVDAAPALIEAARRRNDSDRFAIDYRVGDARRLADVVDAEAFGAVVCVLAIQNVAPLSPVWEGCRRVLEPAGRLVLVMMHPCFRIPRASDWGWDERAARQYRRVEQYLSSTRTEIEIHPGSNPSQTTPTFHRPLQAYVNTLGSAGLTIDRLEEWASHKTSPEGPRKRALDESRREIPMFLALRARKSP